MKLEVQEKGRKMHQKLPEKDLVLNRKCKTDQEMKELIPTPTKKPVISLNILLMPTKKPAILNLNIPQTPTKKPVLSLNTLNPRRKSEINLNPLGEVGKDPEAKVPETSLEIMW